jgi:membrane fusion protein, multidrug efflux system
MKKFFFILYLALFFVYCRGRPQEEDAEEAPVAANVSVEVTRVQQGPIRQMVQATGTLSALPNNDVKVSALVSGRILHLYTFEGDAVKKGQIVSELDASLLRDELREAKAELDNAKLNEVRTARLYEKGIAAGKEKEDARKELTIAQSKYDSARLQMARTQIVAPISGEVVKRFVNVGEQVDGTADQPIVEIANVDEVELLASLATSFLSYVHEGQEAEIRTNAFGETSFNGKIVSVIGAVNSATDTATIRILIPNPGHQLKTGLFATANIVTSVRKDALYIPEKALVTTNNEPKVFVVQPDSTVQERHVQPRWRDANKVEIISGLQKGEMIVTTGSYGLADKMKVTVSKTSGAMNRAPTK